LAAKPVHLHVENARGKPGIYHVTPERWALACRRHPTLARKLRVTFGWDGDALEHQLGTAEIVIGVPAKRDSLATRAPGLRWLHATSAGVDGFLPLDWLPRRVAEKLPFEMGAAAPPLSLFYAYRPDGVRLPGRAP